MSYCTKSSITSHLNKRWLTFGRGKQLVEQTISTCKLFQYDFCRYLTQNLPSLQRLCWLGYYCLCIHEKKKHPPKKSNNLLHIFGVLPQFLLPSAVQLTPHVFCSEQNFHTKRSVISYPSLHDIWVLYAKHTTAIDGKASFNWKNNSQKYYSIIHLI